MTETNKDLKPCPCGKTPTTIGVGDAGQGYKYALAVPNCCGEWMIEFRTVRYDLESEATKAEAQRAWNDAPRASYATDTEKQITKLNDKLSQVLI